MTKPFIKFFALALFTAISSFAQDSSSIKTTTYDANLKGPIKELKSFFPKDFDYKYNANEIRYILYINYGGFNRMGLLTQTISGGPLKSLDEMLPENRIRYTKYNSEDIESKQKRKCMFQTPMRVFDPFLLIPNEYGNHSDPGRWEIGLDSVIRTQSVYDYKFDSKGRIAEVSKFRLVDEKIAVTEKDIKDPYQSLYSREIYYYDNAGRLERQTICIREHEPNILFHNYIIQGQWYSGAGSVFERSFEYDNQNRIGKVILKSGDKEYLSESYTYHPVKGYVSEMVRKAQGAVLEPSALQTHKYVFDENANIIYATTVDAPYSGFPKERFYEYTYDSYNNWIKCKMFINNKENPPLYVFERAIEYYTD